MSDPVKQEEYYRLKEREEQEEKELRAKQREEIIAAIRGLPYKHLLEDCTNGIVTLIEKEEEAKSYRDIEAGLPFSEEVANRLGMLGYAKRYTSNHTDEKGLQKLKRARQERIEKQREKQLEEQKELKRR